jgi:peptide-methionine (S)-S-oxide reductase
MSSKSIETATLAGGCFWGVEDLLRKLPGILETTVGYTGGRTPNPTYPEVKTGTTGHAEAIEIKFDPHVINYESILLFFFQMHDPTTLDRQGNDIGSQYRSEIFFHSPQQESTAKQVIASVDKSGKWKRPIVTKVSPAVTFTPAETYHQDYLEKNPGGYTCHFIRK